MHNRLGFFALAAGLLAAATRPAVAQSVLGLSYDWSLPMGDLKDYADNDSWIGFALEARTFRGDNVSIGGQVGMYEFYTNSSDVITLPAGAISGLQYRHVISVPLMLSVFAHLGQPGSAARPYIGANVGVYYLHQLIDVGTYTVDQDNWLFGVAPELGVMLPVGGRASGTTLHVRYNYPINGGSFLSGEARSFQYLSVGLGFYTRTQ